MAGQAKPLVFRERLEGAFAGEVWATAFPLGLLSAAAAAAGFSVLAGVLLLPALFCLAFFRNPARRGPEGDPGERLALSPADGRVISVAEEAAAGGRLRIGIFLSIFDVHVNRAPLSGEVVSIARSGSEYRAAFAAEVPARNVQLCMALRTAQGLHIEVVQMAGLIARRIVCHPRPGEWLKRGARYGLIRFGSRTDLLLPPGSKALVEKGARVVGGISPLAELPAAPAKAAPVAEAVQ